VQLLRDLLHLRGIERALDDENAEGIAGVLALGEDIDDEKSHRGILH
jgi:hypothetical protein